MKDLRECGEVGPSENGEPIFSCFFCEERLNAMELIIDHINALHKEKVTFKPETLKKRPRRKRKSELPVSEWIHLEKVKKRRSSRVSLKNTSTKHKIINNQNETKQGYEEKENSKPEFSQPEISRLVEDDSKNTNVETNQYLRPRKVSQVKFENKENNTDVVFTKIRPKFLRRKKKRKKKNDFTLVTTNADEEIPIKIRLKRTVKEIIIKNEKNNQNTTAQIKIEENEINKEKKEDDCILKKNVLLIPMELPKEDKQHYKTNSMLNLKDEIFENQNTKPIEDEEKTSNFIKREKYENLNHAIKKEFIVSNDNNLKIEKKINILQEIIEDEQNNEESESSDSEEEFMNNFSINLSNENNCDSTDEDAEYNREEIEESSFSDCDSEKISNLKEKLKKIQLVNRSTLEVQNTIMSIEKVENKIMMEKNAITKNVDNLEAISRKKIKFKSKPKTRKMNEFGEYVCDLCGNTYKKATSLSRHRSDCRDGKIITPRVRTRKENGLFPCTYENCLGEFSNVEDVFKHEKKIHGKKKYARPQIRKRNEFGEYVCDICGNVYKKGTSLSRHRALCREGIVVVPKRKKRDRLRNEKGLYQCAFNSCELEFSRVEDVVSHEKETHKSGKKKKVGRMCEVCGKWLTSACSFKSHMLRHSGERNYKCDQCPGAFYDKYALTLHKKVHTEIKEYECEYCQKKFTRAAEMRKHIRYVHLNLRPDPVMCDLCGKYFHWKFDLKSHMRRHYNVKTIRCEFAECEQMFANRSDLKKHLITHNPDIKPWQCEICSNSFSRKSTLVKHQKLHTGTKDYTCSICGKAFAQSPGLYMHMKSHGFNLKPEGAGRYERISHMAYRQMDSDRISNLNFKQNNEAYVINQDDIQNNSETKNEITILNRKNNCNFESTNSEKYMMMDENSKDSISEKLAMHHQENQVPLKMSANQITTIHIKSIPGVLNGNIINSPTVTTLGNEIQINLEVAQ